ncbi:MAG: diacylglycerol/polyprenol kinase family protein [Bdellovibrionota bacterium]
MKREAHSKQISWGAFPIRLHLRSDLHLARKSWHMVMGMAIAFSYLGGVSRTSTVLFLGTILGWDLAMETARLKIPSFNEKIMRIWGPFMRTCEMDRFSAIPHYLASTILAVGIFPKPVAILSILYLACGDPIASLAGILYGHKSIRLANGKSLVGTAAGILTCAVVTWIFLKAIGISDSASLVLTLVGGLAGGLTELLPFEIDDNFTIPVISGFILWFTFILLGI